MQAKIPAYQRVYNALKARILEGDYGVGELLPSEPELERQFGVSRTTVRKAVENLSRGAGFQHPSEPERSDVHF